MYSSSPTLGCGPRPLLLCQIALVSGRQARRALLQPWVRDPAAAHHVVVRERHRVKAELVPEALVPLEAFCRTLQELLNLGSANRWRPRTDVKVAVRLPRSAHL